MRYSVIESFNIENGPGTRVVIWTQGCEHHCEGCHNPHTWKMNHGKIFNQEVAEHILNELDSYFPKDLSILGGEPLHPQNREGTLELCRFIKSKRPKTNIWIWTGYELEEIIDDKSIFENVDTLVTGRFKIDLLTRYKYYGSSNQKIVHTSQEAMDLCGEGELLDQG